MKKKFIALVLLLILIALGLYVNFYIISVIRNEVHKLHNLEKRVQHIEFILIKDKVIDIENH